MATIIGRQQETELLKTIYRRDEAQLVAVYGRRRVGKTFLIRETFGNEFAFYHTGISPVGMKNTNLLALQLQAFGASLERYGSFHSEPPKDWFAAFDYLRELLEQRSSIEKLVVFIDEMPWLDTPRSQFVSAFEFFWNSWGAGQHNLMLIVCGSATAWIKNKLINAYGGLYNRITAEVQLCPFTLRETEELLTQHGIHASRYDIAELYMAVGGIPYYLNYVAASMSIAQNIDNLFFNKKAPLKDEFDRLFHSLFSQPENYKAVVRLLSTKHIGFSREEISVNTHIPTGASLTQILRALEQSDFIESYHPFGENKRVCLYRLIDPFCRFYLQHIEGKKRDEHYWQNNQNLPALNSWRGIAFEEICLVHIAQIKRALGIEGVTTEQSAWAMRGTDTQSGMQIDLILSRQDRVVNVCEMKFVSDEFTVTQTYDATLRQRRTCITEQIPKKYSVQMTLVTTFGVKYGTYSSAFQRVITLNDLFV